jgi:hypothetical protein
MSIIQRLKTIANVSANVPMVLSWNRSQILVFGDRSTSLTKYEGGASPDGSIRMPTSTLQKIHIDGFAPVSLVSRATRFFQVVNTKLMNSALPCERMGAAPDCGFTILRRRSAGFIGVGSFSTISLNPPESRIRNYVTDTTGRTHLISSKVRNDSATLPCQPS